MANPTSNSSDEDDLQKLINEASSLQADIEVMPDLDKKIFDEGKIQQQTHLPHHSPTPSTTKSEAKKAPTTNTPQIPDVDGTFTLTISPDQLTATITALPATGLGRDLPMREMFDQISQKPMLLNLSEAALMAKLQEVFERKSKIENLAISLGTAAHPGKDAEILELFKPTPLDQVASTLSSEFSEKVRDAKQAARIGARTILARIAKNDLGVPGKNIFDEVIPVTAGVNPYQAGENVSTKTDGNKLIFESTITGLAVLKDNVFNVYPCQDGDAVIEIEKDNMKASLTLIPQQGVGRPLLYTDVFKKLSAAGIVYGQKKEQIDLEFKKYEETKQLITFVVAEGDIPVHGENGRVEFHVATEITKKIKIDSHGNIKWREKDNIIAVEKNTRIATLYLPTFKVSDGRNILGVSLPAQDGQPVDLKVISGITKTEGEKGTILYTSEISGEFSYNPKTKEIVVNPSKTVPIINLDVGNISFNGNLTVVGNIEDDMIVDCSGDLTVNGMILAAQVTCGGTVLCLGGILTKNRGWIKAKGDVRAKFIENSLIESLGDVFVEKAIMTSRVSALGSVYVDPNAKSVIVGGRVHAKKYIVTNELGKDTEVKTVVMLGSDFRTLEEYENLHKKMEDLHTEMAKHDLILNKLQKTAPLDKFTPQMKVLFRQELLKKNQLLNEVKEAKQRSSELHAALVQHQPAELVVPGLIHPGTQVIFGMLSTKISVIEKASAFTRAKNDAGLIRRAAVDAIKEVMPASH